MILAGLVGLALQRFAALPEALLPAILIGFLVARLVPDRGECGRERPQP